MSDHKPKLLDSAAPISDRLRIHAHRMTYDETLARQQYGYVTEPWEREDLLAVLDAAADENDALIDANARIEELEGAQILNRNAIKRKGDLIAALEAERDALAKAIKRVQRIRLDLEYFDGDRRGHMAALDDAEHDAVRLANAALAETEGE